MMISTISRIYSLRALIGSVLVAVGLLATSSALAQGFCDGKQTITANVVVLDNPTVFNRLGAQNPNWITYALKRDVVHWDDGNPDESDNGKPCTTTTGVGPNFCKAGNVQLRPDKRTRPLVVRSVAGACLTVTFTNLLAPVANPNNAQLNTPNPAFPVLDGDPGLNCADPANANNRVCILANNDQVAGRCAGFHATGTELVSSMADDGSMVGANAGANIGDSTNDPSTTVCGPGMAGPDDTVTYELYTPHEGAFVINSYGATLGGEASSGNLGIGMFGALNVQPKGARMYRSQVTEEELRLATTGLTSAGQPIIDYEATYPNISPWSDEGKGDLPILNMLDGNELVHSDINAIIAGPDPDGTWTTKCPGPECPYPLESVGKNNPSYPNRLDPFREFASVFHDEQTNSEVFPRWYNDPVLSYTLTGVRDHFMINYGSGGIGSEIIANRLHAGPMHDCTDCAYEEFFLASQTVGDPGMLVNYPANSLIESCDPRDILSPDCWRQFNDPDHGPVGANPPIRVEDGNGGFINNFALFQEDPANVHHAYTGDHVKMRNIHTGAFEQHIFHFHNHQWLFNPNDDNGNYLDAQEIMPGSGHTYELVYGGAGNRNKTVGDAIFHCHFYPHFAQGMWYHMRNHDVFERGTVLAVSGASDPQNPPLDGNGFHQNDANGDGKPDWALRSGQPAAGARALPDGELPDGSPIPAVVPLPGKPMPPMPATVTVKAVDRGDYGVLAGRTPPNGLGQGPDSAQAVVYRTCAESGAPASCIPALGADGEVGGTGANADRSPGYPFWLAGNECGPGAGATDDVCPQGTVGQRMPTPALDMLTEAGATAATAIPLFANVKMAQAGGWDGGLPRHNLRGYTSGGFSLDTQNRLDFRKVVEIAQPVYYPELGTDLEQVSMAYQAERNHPSSANNLSGGPTGGVNFVLNGSAPVPGGPFNDPCVDDRGTYLGNGVLGQWFDGTGGTSIAGRSDFHGDNPRTYRIANVQIDAVFNKVGHHYPQERIIALWGDVQDTIDKLRPPEPLVMRFNTFDCGKILHANLVPAEFELDDFQVRTPTDIIGQHIHLPKWDLTSNDGAANGWNYEDGTLSPIMVQERILAINHFNKVAGQSIGAVAAAIKLGFDDKVHPDVVDALTAANTTLDLTDLAPVLTIDTGDPGGTPAGLGCDPNATDANPLCPEAAGGELQALPHPFFGRGVPIQVGDSATTKYEYDGARTTIQRILNDPVVNVAGVDRGLGLTFSHDHYGPSSFQQIGLYSTILAEPAGSTWRHNESGVPLGGRLITLTDDTQVTDGGPTSWQAVIDTSSSPPYAGSDTIKSHREFYFEMSDFQHAYNAGVYVGADADGKPLLTTIDQPNAFNAAVATASLIADKWKDVVNPPLKLMHNPGPDGGDLDVVTAKAACPGGPIGAPVNFDPNVPRPCAEAINLAHSSTWVINYRNEPVGLRVFDPNATGPDGQNGAQAAGKAGDLAFALQTRIDRAQPLLNTSFGDTPGGWQNAPYCENPENGDLINCDRRPGDPFTPIMRAYERDEVKVKVQVGATEEQHQVTVHGMKWLSNGSAFGRSPNSGWRNFQSHGISEQFTLQVPITTVPQQPGDVAEYLYATDATRDGMWLGAWGLLRAYRDAQNDLYQLPDNPAAVTQFANADAFNGVCPTDAAVAHFDVSAVLANDVLPNTLGVYIPDNIPVGGVNDNAGGVLDPMGGTLVYNRRQTNVPGPTGGTGPLHDPTAIMYVLTEDLEVIDAGHADCTGIDPVTGDPVPSPEHPNAAILPGCPARLKSDAPVEPLVLRANAGQCIEVNLRNRLPEVAPDLAGWQDMMWGVTRRFQGAGVNEQMYFFNNNLIRPSSHVGLHPQLVAYDINRHDGVQVGTEDDVGEELQLAPPGGAKFYRWYAGDISYEDAAADACSGGKGRPTRGNRNNNNGDVKCVNLVATPVEFGAVNLLSADRVKQPQKGLFGALAIEPAGATVAEDTLVPDGQGSGDATRRTRAQVTVTSPVPSTNPAGSGGEYREALAMAHKLTNLRWSNGNPVRNIHQGELGREGAEDSGHAGFNYGMEPSWFRFQLPPDAEFGNAGTPGSFGAIPNVQAFYANKLVDLELNTIPDIPGVSEAGDPQTPVFRAEPGQATRMHLLNGASADRDGTFVLHGHLWQRDPFVCPGQNELGLEGRCNVDEPVPSRALGLNPQGKWMGGEEGMGHAYGHWPILFEAGGSNAANLGCTAEQPCDFLYRDYAPNGNRNGQFGILRVTQAPQVDPCAGNVAPTATIAGSDAGSTRNRDRLSWSAAVTDEFPSTVTYAWEFRDPNGELRGSPGTGETFTVRLNRRWPTGTYTVSLTVTDACGAPSEEALFEVTVTQ